MTRRLLRIILFLLFLEIFLRIGGFVSLRIQDFQNHFDFNAKQSYRILCVGESMTMVGGDQSYPRILEEVLNQKHLSKKFQVIDKGISGVNSDVIMDSMESFLDEYKPDMVIAMMGLNDSSGDPFFVETRKTQGAFFKTNKFFYNLRVCKLFRGIYKDFKNNFITFFHCSVPSSKTDAPIKRTQQNTIYDVQEDYSQGPSDENTAKALQLGMICILKKDYADAEMIFRILIASPQAKIYGSKSTFYHYLALILYQEAKVKELVLTLENIPFWNWYDIPVINFCDNQENAALGIASFKKLHDEFPNIPFYSDMIYQCYAKSGNTKEADKWKEESHDLMKNQVNIKTKLNYLRLLDILKRKNVTPVLMQYPLRDVESLKSMVSTAPDDERVIFIDNETVFKEAVKNEGYDAIFSDYLGGDFGHPTLKGRKILAENITKTLINAMNWK